MTDNALRTTGGYDQSVQVRADTKAQVYAAGQTDAFAYFAPIARMQRITDVPLYGTSYNERSRRLRQLWTLAGAEPAQAAILAYIHKIQTNDWQFEGPSRLAKYYRTVLHNADFGRGWDEFVARSAIDYLTQDNGVFWEIIGDGKADEALPDSSPVLGVAHLDSRRCTRTGNVTYPVIYTDMDGVMHQMHYTRVMFASDMPSPDERLYGMGFCALSRCIAAIQTMINWSEMRNEFIDDMPPLGILTFSHINREMFLDQYKAYEKERASKEQSVYRGLLMLFNPSQEIKMEYSTFRQTWEGFKEKDMYDICIDLTAMAFGLDRTELTPLTGHTLGAGSQAAVLNQKSRGKGISNLLSLFERFINRITPWALKFKFFFQDDEQDRTQAEIQAIRMRNVLAMYTATPVQSSMTVDNVPLGNGGVTKQPGLITKEEARYLLVKEGVLPREILTAEEEANPDWQRFDIVVSKARLRYGDLAIVDKAGNVREPMRMYRKPSETELFLGAKSA